MIGSQNGRFREGPPLNALTQEYEALYGKEELICAPETQLIISTLIML